MKQIPVTIVETKLFERKAAQIWTDDDLNAFKNFIAAHPDAGDVIEGTGGIRKVRWSRRGSGKRGGVRVIYFYYDQRAPIYLVTIFAKSAQGDLKPAEKKAIAALTAAIKRDIDARR